MKKLLLSLIVLSQAGFCLTLDDLTSPKPLFGRMGTSEKIETIDNITLKQPDNVIKAVAKNEIKPKIEIKNKTQIAPKTQATIEKTDDNITETVDNTKLQQETIEEQPFEEIENKTLGNAETSYADLSLKRLAQDVSYELDIDEAKTTADLAILWAAATERSETMKYTIYKLSNPDEDKPNDSMIKKILKPIANFSGVAGASIAGDPFVATGALIGGGLVNAFMSDDKEYNYKFSKVSDADMVLLVRKIDDLQKKLLDLYIDYKTKEQIAKMTQENFEKREEIYKNSQTKSREELVIADVYYRNAKTSAIRAQDDYLTSRSILSNLVGIEALNQIEKEE